MVEHQNKTRKILFYKLFGKSNKELKKRKIRIVTNELQRGLYVIKLFFCITSSVILRITAC